jgi:uncharacterized protein (TIGR00730 family)
MKSKIVSLPEKKIVFPQEDFRKTNERRLKKITQEFKQGFEFIAKLKKSVTFFGSAEISSSDPLYQDARKLAYLLAKKGMTIITGGGPGIMEAANRGASEAQGESIGLNIELPEVQRTNPYVKKSIGFHYFFTRKVFFSLASSYYIFFPGGYGTLSEFFEMINLIQTKKMQRPQSVIVYKSSFWQPLMQWLNKTLLANKMIEKKDIQIIQLTDSVEEIAKMLK